MMRIGQGYDLHQLVEGSPLIIGGIEIPSEKGCLAHSDGDVLIHAIIDSLLGAAALGDIGSHFPPSDEKWKDAHSGALLKEIMKLIGEKGWCPVNVDTTIVLERPKLRPHIDRIRKSLSALLSLPLDAISVKAKTKEKQDSTGQGHSIEAQAVVLIAKE